MRRFFAHPRLLEFTYRLSFTMLTPIRRWMAPGSWLERLFISLEKFSKGALFDCRMCGQCVLHSSGMICPMTCPKEMRNGPCGGVLPDGNCEIFPDRPCVWVLAWERSKTMPVHGKEIHVIQTPLNHSLQGTSAWVNEFHRKRQMIPKGWDE